MLTYMHASVLIELFQLLDLYKQTLMNTNCTLLTSNVRMPSLGS